MNLFKLNQMDSTIKLQISLFQVWTDSRLAKSCSYGRNMVLPFGDTTKGIWTPRLMFSTALDNDSPLSHVISVGDGKTKENKIGCVGCSQHHHHPHRAPPPPPPHPRTGALTERVERLVFGGSRVIDNENCFFS